jgi:hypothetical protein
MRPYVTAQGVVYYVPVAYGPMEAETGLVRAESMRLPTPEDQLDMAQDGQVAEMPKGAAPAPVAAEKPGVPVWAWVAGAGAVAYFLFRK